MVSEIFCTPTWGRDPVWLAFFSWVETTNQIYMRVEQKVHEKGFQLHRTLCIYFVFLHLIWCRFFPRHHLFAIWCQTFSIGSMYYPQIKIDYRGLPPLRLWKVKVWIVGFPTKKCHVILILVASGTLSGRVDPSYSGVLVGQVWARF